MGSVFVNDMNRKNTVVIACEMVEDEVRKAMENTGADYPVIWVERGYHNEPDDLREELKVLVRYAETSRIEEDIRTKELTVDPYAAIPESMKTRKQKRTVTTPLYPGNEINGDLENILIVFGLPVIRQAGVFLPEINPAALQKALDVAAVLLGNLAFKIAQRFLSLFRDAEEILVRPFFNLYQAVRRHLAKKHAKVRLLHAVIFEIPEDLTIRELKIHSVQHV